MGAELARAASLHAIDVQRVQRWVLDTLLPDQRRAVHDSRPLAGTILGDLPGAFTTSEETLRLRRERKSG